MKRWLCWFWIAALWWFPGIAAAEEWSPTYAEALTLAKVHAANPGHWRPASLFVIPDTTGGTTEGLVYDGGKLIVRTASKSRHFKGNYVGEWDYKVYGPATTEAAWVTTGNDATRFLLANGVTGDNATILLERGLGMDSTGDHDAIIEFAADPSLILRPTRNPDIGQYLPAQYGQNLPFVQPAGMSDETFSNFKAYYEHWVNSAYGPYRFPFTQLGYTFFWGNGVGLEGIKGMSEFIILGRSPVDIYGIYATRSYIYTRNDGTAFSQADDAVYGNGFASFKIDGSCDTVWAGHRFQKKVIHDTAEGSHNQILIEKGGSIAGGQGILIWSLNYDVVNSGRISGATADKFGIAGTANVALLFKGDTSGSYGNPIAAGHNCLINYGTISSPGTAVKAEAGDTVIVNHNGGVIAGDVFAVQTGTGNDTVTVNGGEIRGRVDLGPGTDDLSVTGAGSTTFAFTLDTNDNDLPQIANTETVTIADHSTTLSLSVAGSRNVRNRDRFLVVDADRLNVDPAKLAIQNSLPMVSFTTEKIGGQLSVLATRDATFYGKHSGNASLGNVLDVLATTATGEMGAVLAALDASGDAAANTPQFEPLVNGGILEAGFGTADKFNQAIVMRIDQIRVSRGRKGGAGAAAPADDGLWGQGFGATLRQEPRDGRTGYQGNLWGGAFGYDRLVRPHLLLGFGGGFAKSRFSTGDRETRTHVDTYQGHLYGSLIREGYYLDAVLSVSYHSGLNARHVDFGGIDRAARGDYPGRQISGILEGGYAVYKGGWVLTPLLALQAMHLQLDGFTETGAGALNLQVEGERYRLFQTGAGVKVAYPFRIDAWRITPELYARWHHDFVGDRQQSQARFAGGGGTFKTEGFEPVANALQGGARLTLAKHGQVSLSLHYGHERKADFSGHSGALQLRCPF